MGEDTIMSENVGCCILGLPHSPRRMRFYVRVRRGGLTDDKHEDIWVKSRCLLAECGEGKGSLSPSPLDPFVLYLSSPLGRTANNVIVLLVILIMIIGITLITFPAAAIVATLLSSRFPLYGVPETLCEDYYSTLVPLPPAPSPLAAEPTNLRPRSSPG